MKKFMIFLLVIFMIAGIGGAVYFYVQYTSTKGEKETLVMQNAELQHQIDAIGPVTVAYTVAGEVTSGTVIKIEDLVELTVPQASVVDTNTITVPEEIEGKLWKVDVKPGTTITADLIMEDIFTEILTERDLTFKYLPLGLKPADYVDIRIVYPYGEMFNVIPHKRIEEVVSQANTIKVWLTPAEQILWESALKDVALNEDKGVKLDIIKYVEPGISGEVIAFYPVRKEMESIVNLNPNIPNKKACINSVLREQMEIMLANVTEEDGGKSSAGVNNEAAGIENAKEAFVPSDSSPSVDGENLQGAEEDQNVGDIKNVDNLVDLNTEMENVEENLDDLEGTIGTEKQDGDGNTSSVTTQEKEESKGKPLFGDEEVIE